MIYLLLIVEVFNSVITEYKARKSKEKNQAIKT